MKKLLDPDIDDAMSSIRIPNKQYLALVAGKTVDTIDPIPVYKTDILLLGEVYPLI
jgi:hypothetical protein